MRKTRLSSDLVSDILTWVLGNLQIDEKDLYLQKYFEASHQISSTWIECPQLFRMNMLSRLGP